jgi:hypothetical protein
VYDTNFKLSKYWWREFLELSESYTDSYNTKTALDVLDRKIFNQIKKDFPSDHTILRNSSIKYFRSQNNFELTDYVSDVFENYKPIDPAFPRDDIVNRVVGLPERWGFDNSFAIIKEDISQRMVTNKIMLTEQIDLILNDYIENIGSVIVSDKEKDGKKYIKIYSENGYERFKSGKQ